MQASEVPHLNVFYVQTPEISSTMIDTLPHREEIAHPNKLIALAQLQEKSWDPFTLNTLNLQRTWVTWRKSYIIENQKISSSGFYALTEDSKLFSSILEVDSECPNAMYNWLKTWGKSYAIITCPLMVFYTPSNTILYSIPNDINTQPFQIVPIFDLTEQFIEQAGYTIISGFTLALAVHRLNIWQSDIFKIALQNWFSEFDLEQPWMQADASNAFLFLQHPIPHICDHPLHYSVMGKDKASKEIVAYLKEKIYLNMDDPMVQLFTTSRLYYTTVAASMFPYLNQNIFEMFEPQWLSPPEESFDDGCIINQDLGGFIVSICKSRSQYYWWLKNRHRYESFLKSQNINKLLHRLFHMYNYTSDYGIRKSRIRGIWQHLLNIISERKMSAAVMRMVMVNCIHARLLDTHIRQWMCNIPIAFIKDFRTKTKEQFDIFGSINHRLYFHQRHSAYLHSLFGDKITINTDLTEDRHHYNAIVRMSMIQLLRCFPEGIPLHYYGKIIDHEIAKSLWTLKKGFYDAEKDQDCNYTLWMILDTHLKDNMNLWI